MTSLSTGSEENKEGPRTGDGEAITVASTTEKADATTPLTVVADSVKAARETGDQVDAVSPARPADTELEEIAGFKVHPLASRWPLIVGQQFEDFVEAASHCRSLQAVETNNGFLIDGRNRLRVQEELRRRGSHPNPLALLRPPLHTAPLLVGSAARWPCRRSCSCRCL